MNELNLSQSEYEVLELLKNGNSPKEVAAIRQVSLRTIESHIFNMYSKGGFEHIYQLLAYKGKINISTAQKYKRSELVEKIAELTLSGKNHKEIIQELNISKQTYGMCKRLIKNTQLKAS